MAYTTSEDGEAKDVRDIPPALSTEAWQASKDAAVLYLDLARPDVSRVAMAIALANAAYPDEDPRKLSWETVDMLRSIVSSANLNALPGYGEPIIDLGDVLASYLPPREPL